MLIIEKLKINNTIYSYNPYLNMGAFSLPVYTIRSGARLSINGEQTKPAAPQ
jgi:hypothetical protein